MNKPHITVCICTCGRPELLRRLLLDLAKQETLGAMTFSVVVADNDAAHPAREVVERCAGETGLSINYALEPERNIALARNKAVSLAGGEFLAFIDDDEFPDPAWLSTLLAACQAHKAAGVLGPVLPHFDETPPAWLVKGGFYDRPAHPTGFALPWNECRTGNVLLRRELFSQPDPPFRREFGSGGEDQDFFQRMMGLGHSFIWCDEAPVYEVVPRSRWSRRFLLHRALLRGRNSLRHRKGRGSKILKSAIAVPAYALALPFLFFAGQHYFMRYLVKSADHAGRLLAFLGINRMKERPM
jgi:succinoglycan biosynthesis protein ExoM